MQMAPALPEGAVAAAIDRLLAPGPLELEELLDSVQQACEGLVALVGRGGRLPSDLLESALEAACRGLGAARQQLEAAPAPGDAALAAVQRGGWSQAALAAADACLHSEAWHAALHADGTDGREAHKRSVSLVKDMLKDDLLAVVAAAAGALTFDTGFCLAAQYRAVLEMGTTAADVVGQRDARHSLEGMRSFSVVNTLWNSAQKLWTAVPQAARPDMERQGLGAGVLACRVLGFFRADVRACHSLLVPGMGKLLVYWLQRVHPVLDDHHAAVPAAWSALTEVPLAAARELVLLGSVAAGGGGEVCDPQEQEQRAATAAGLLDTLQMWVLPWATRLLASCLAWTNGEDQLRVMLDALRMKLSAGGPNAAPALHAVARLLAAAPTTPPLVRHHCVSLLDSVLEAVPGPAFEAALASAVLRCTVSDGVLAFLAAACHAATSAAGNPALEASDRQLAAQTWERCQQQLFRHALRPHPLTAQLLGSVWTDLASAAAEPLLQSHVAALRQLLHLEAAAAAAGAACHEPPSPLHMQLLGLLACLLVAAPPHLRRAYFANFLQVLPDAEDDACQLACLAAELRLATLVDAACNADSAGPAAAACVQRVLESLYARLMATGPTLMKRLSADGGAGSDDACAYLACLLEALQCAVAYFASTGAPQAPGSEAIMCLPSRLATVLEHAVVRRGVFAVAAPALSALRGLHTLSPLSPPDLESLIPALAACAARPETAAAAAALAPALARCTALHAHVLHAVLSARSPLMHHLGLEALRIYAKTCPGEALAAAVPPSMRSNPDTGFAVLMQQYVQRVPGAAGDTAAWLTPLQQAALGAAAALRRAVEAHRAAAPAGHSSDSEGAAGSAAAAAAAAEGLALALAQLDAALAGASPDAATARTLHQCSARLSQLLGVAG